MSALILLANICKSLSMLTNLKLKNRMLLGYAIPVVVYLGFAALVYSSINKVNETFSEVKRVEAVTRAVSDMGLSAESIIRSARGYLLNKNSKFLDDYESEKKQFQADLKVANPLIHRTDQKQRLQKMNELVKEYGDYSERMISLRKQNKQAEAIALFSSGTGTRTANEFSDLLDEFLKAEKELLDQKTHEAESNLQAVAVALIAGSLLIVGLAIFVALVISSGISRMIHQAIQAIASSSAEIAATVAQHERTAMQQSVSVNQTTTTMGELGASSHQSAEQAEAAAQRAQRVLALVRETRSDMQLGQVSSLREKVDQIAEQILRLSEQTNQIGSISSLVSDLANQTNMLALNAAVEAVRAGEQGKGFAVVAAEIRKLADQSKKSAERINALVTEVQNATNSTVMVTDEGTKMVEAIVLEVNDIALNNQQISLTAKQQAIAVQQVVDAMTAINQGASETAAGISQTKVGTQKLNEAADKLKSVV